MKQIFYLILIALTLSSCSSTFYYTTLESTNKYVDKVENGDFLIETDSLWIAYCFKGENAPVQITVFNKSDKPIYVDWKRSAMIIDNVAYSYTGGTTPIKGNTWNNSYGSDNQYSFGGFEGAIEMSDKTAFIPPQTMISETPFIIDPDLRNLHKELYKNISMSSKSDRVFSAKRADFEESDSPLHFRSYLTIYTEPDKPMVFEQDFYISSIIKTSMKPQNIPGDLIERGDIFYLYQPANNTAFYTTLTVVGVGAIVVGAAAAGNDMPDVDY